jgi:Ca2+-binding EF-hand superfamily protein
MIKSISLLSILVMLALPASAADQKQCEDRFKAADIDNDGALSRTELGNAKQSMPASLANKDRVTREEFMAACTRSAS